MEKQVFSLHDEKANAYTQPFFMDQKGQALRALDGIVNSPDSNVNKYPQDFKLYKLGTFNDWDGVLTSLATPELIANATDFVKLETKKEN